MFFRCPLAVLVGHLKIAPLPALLTSWKELSWSSSHKAQRWLDDGYQGKSIPLSQQHLGVITSHWEAGRTNHYHFSMGIAILFPSSWFNKVKNWRRTIGLWFFISFLGDKKKKRQYHNGQTRQREKREKASPWCVSMHTSLSSLLLFLFFSLSLEILVIVVQNISHDHSQNHLVIWKEMLGVLWGTGVILEKCQCQRANVIHDTFMFIMTMLTCWC